MNLTSFKFEPQRVRFVRVSHKIFKHLLLKKKIILKEIAHDILLNIEYLFHDF